MTEGGKATAQRIGELTQTIVTILVLLGATYMGYTGTISGQETITVYMTVLGYIFGKSQAESHSVV